MGLSFLSMAGNVGYGSFLAYQFYSRRKEVERHNRYVLDYNIVLPSDKISQKCKKVFKFLVSFAILPYGIYKVSKKIFKSIGRPSFEKKLTSLQAEHIHKNTPGRFSSALSKVTSSLSNRWNQVQHREFTSHDGKILSGILIPSANGLSSKVIVQVALSTQDAEAQRATWINQYAKKAPKHALFIVCPRSPEKALKMDYKEMAQDVFCAARQLEKNRKKVTSIMGCDTLGSLVAAKAANLLQKKHPRKKISTILFSPVQSISSFVAKKIPNTANRLIAFASKCLGFDIQMGKYLKRLRGKIIVVHEKNHLETSKEAAFTKENAGYRLTRKCKWEKTNHNTYSGSLVGFEKCKLGSLIKSSC